MEDAKLLHALEEWHPSTAHKGATKFLTTMEEFQMRMVASARKIALRPSEKEQFSPSFKRRIKETFVDTLCFLFDGMLTIATAPPEPSNGRRPSRVAIAKSTSKDIVCPSFWPGWAELTCRNRGFS